ncbi:MAG: lytic transglycosylase domain-containing protein [Christensenellaceae bacterium]|nr:lytic transglycosylase domain-containing protein [Christensenellaceae bacterium]
MKDTKRLIFIIGSITMSAVLVLVLVLVVYYSRVYPFNYKEDILASAAQYHIRPEIVASVINAESGYNKDAYSRAGAIGLMQILPSTGEYIAAVKNEQFSQDMLWEAGTNIEFGCCYMRYLFDRFSDPYTALAAYNAGEGTVRKWLKDLSLSDDGITLKHIPYEETRRYIEKIKAGEEVYKNKF